jgi:hypothetical protein
MVKFVIERHYLEFDDNWTLEVVVDLPLLVMWRGFFVEAWRSAQGYTFMIRQSAWRDLSRMPQGCPCKRVSVDKLMFVALTTLTLYIHNCYCYWLSSSCFPRTIHPPELSGVRHTSALYDVRAASDEIANEMEFKNSNSDAHGMWRSKTCRTVTSW